MSNENKKPDDATTKPQLPNLALPHPEVIAKIKFYAEHEAGHAVVTDDLGWTVLKVNADPRKGKVKMDADWGTFKTQLDNTGFNDPAQREAIKPRLLDYITTLVAGHLIENNPKEPPVSERIKKELWQLDDDPTRLDSDRDRVIHWLRFLRMNRLDEVLAAEKRALDILTRRKDHHRALADLACKQGIVEGIDLETALGKRPNPPSPPAPAPEQAPPG
jgi:hypothetical protein